MVVAALPGTTRSARRPPPFSLFQHSLALSSENYQQHNPPQPQKFANMPSSQPKEGGIKGFLSRAGYSFYAGGIYCKEKSWVAARMAGNLAFIVATTSMVVLMPLIFEIMREGQVGFAIYFMRNNQIIDFYY